jgi:hypothetical protein
MLTLILPPLVCINIAGEPPPPGGGGGGGGGRRGEGLVPCHHQQSIGINYCNAPDRIACHQDRVAACDAIAGVEGHHRDQPHPTARAPAGGFFCAALAPIIPPPSTQVLHNADSGIRRGHDASLPIVVLPPSLTGAAPGLNDAIRPQRRKVRTRGGERRSIPAVGDGQESQRDHPPRPYGNAVAFSSHADTWMMDLLSALLLSWTTTSASKCSKPFLGTIEGTVTFLGGGGAIQGPVKGFCCTREGSFARVTLGQFAAGSFASLFSWTYRGRPLAARTTRKGSNCVGSPIPFHPSRQDGLTLRNDLEKRRELFLRFLFPGLFLSYVMKIRLRNAIARSFSELR